MLPPPPISTLFPYTTLFRSSWVHYGLGSINQNLPAFIVLVTPGKGDQPLYARLWGSGFLDTRYQGIQFRAGKERSEEHTSELQSLRNLVCRLLLEKKNNRTN